jgi:hypothetical protein
LKISEVIDRIERTDPETRLELRVGGMTLRSIWGYLNTYPRGVRSLTVEDFIIEYDIDFDESVLELEVN